MQKFLERCSRIKDLNAQIISSKLERINYATSYLEESVKSFHERLPISSKVVSSALVERTLFWQKLKQNPLKGGEPLRFPQLKGLFKEFVEWSVLLETLLDTDERLDLKLKRGKGATESKIMKTISKVRYVETRNLFAHGKELLVPMPLTHLLPADAYAQSEYDIDSEEWWNPTFETIAYVHLSKTLHFVKGFTDLPIKKDS